MTKMPQEWLGFFDRINKENNYEDEKECTKTPRMTHAKA